MHVSIFHAGTDESARDALPSLGPTPGALHVDAFTAPSAAASWPLRHSRLHIPSSQLRSFPTSPLCRASADICLPACLPRLRSIDRAFYKFLSDVSLIAFSSSWIFNLLHNKSTSFFLKNYWVFQNLICSVCLFFQVFGYTLEEQIKISRSVVQFVSSSLILFLGFRKSALQTAFWWSRHSDWCL